MDSPYGMPPDSPQDMDDVPYPCKGCGEVRQIPLFFGKSD